MRPGYAVVIMLCFFGITACAPVQTRFQKIQLPPERIVQKGYSLVPLNEKGWLIIGRNQYQLTLAKEGANTDESIVIQATPFRLPEFKSTEEFVRLIKEGQARDTNSERFDVKRHEVTAYPKKGSDCAKSYLMTRDNAALKRSGRSGSMILEALTLACANPKDRKIGISITYSHRYYPGQGDPEFMEKAMSVLNSIEFGEL